MVAAAVTGVFGMIVRPVLVRVAAAIGWLAVALGAIAGQAVVMHLVLLLVPGVDVDSFWTLVAATWIAAAFGTLLTWMLTAGTDDAFTAALRPHAPPAKVADPEVDGVVFVQLDGVPFPVAAVGAAVGHGADAPALGRQPARTALHEWTRAAAVHHAGQPAGHPARHRAPGCPAFRWYDRELGRVLVANRPGRRRGHRGAGQQRPRAARRRRRLDLQPVHRRRARGR